MYFVKVQSLNLFKELSNLQELSVCRCNLLSNLFIKTIYQKYQHLDEYLLIIL